MKKTLAERFLSYTAINTTTDPEAGAKGVMPSTAGQITLGKQLVEELKNMPGVINIQQQENGIVTAELPANVEGDYPTIAFFAHLDTASEHNTDTHARLVPYQGGDVVLENGVKILRETNPELAQYEGDELFVSDGLSLLGADDKAGIAAIMEMMQYFTDNPEIPHGTVKVGFVPDEEQGLLGSKAFDLPNFADFGYTVDGGAVGEFVFENWNAGRAEIDFKGVTAHPMNSKGKLKNALLIANKFIQLFPAQETPEATAEKEGYYWMTALKGSTGEAHLQISVRDFDVPSFKARRAFIENAAASFNALYGEGTVTCQWIDEYFNVGNFLSRDDNPRSPINLALNAMKENGIEPKVIALRGGYDGVVLSEKGIPCPNIFTGAHNYHSIYEYLPLKSLQGAANVVKAIIQNAVK